MSPRSNDPTDASDGVQVPSSPGDGREILEQAFPPIEIAGKPATLTPAGHRAYSRITALLQRNGAEAPNVREKPTSRTITRRSALRASGLAALAGGLLGAVPVAGASTSDPSLLEVLCRETRPEDNARYAEWLAEWRADYQKAREKRDAIDARLKMYLPPALHFELVSQLDNAIYEGWALENDRHRELVNRHLPGLEPVLRLLNAHLHEVHMHQEQECGDGGCRDGY